MKSENSNANCDTGSELSKLAAAFPELDFSHVDPTFPSKSADTPYAFARSAIQTRGETCLRRLYARSEKVIAVVSHSAFLRTAICRRRFANADYRIFTFAKDQHGNLTLSEDGETEQHGGGMGRSEIGVFEIRDHDFPSENLEVME